jgi:hypothetical protein
MTPLTDAQLATIACRDYDDCGNCRVVAELREYREATREIQRSYEWAHGSTLVAAGQRPADVREPLEESPIRRPPHNLD